MQNNGLRATQAENVDSKCPRTWSDCSDGALDSSDDVPRMREKCSTIKRQLDSAGGTGEQPNFQLAFQGGDTLRDGLLCHTQLVGCMLQLSELCRPYE